MNYVDKLQKSPYKLTDSRLAVLKYLEKQKKPKTIKEIHKTIKEKRINLTSVYRTIKVFQKIGIVFEEHFLNQAYYYLDEKRHHHIVCSNCHYIECFPCDKEIKKPANFKNIHHKLVITGLCKKCAN